MQSFSPKKAISFQGLLYSLPREIKTKWSHQWIWDGSCGGLADSSVLGQMIILVLAETQLLFLQPLSAEWNLSKPQDSHAVVRTVT
jgi:hypothetical protein